MYGRITKFTPGPYEHMDVFRLLMADSKPQKTLWNEYFRRIPFVLQCYDRYGKHGAAVVRYLILVYDKQSPHRLESPIMEHRKKEVAKLVGLNKYIGFEAIMNLEDDSFIDALSDYLKFQDDLVWSLIVQNEEVFYSNQEQILKQLNDSESKDLDRLKASEYQGKLLAQQAQIRVELKALYDEFTGQDSQAERAMKRRKPFAPEVVAEMLTYEGFDEEE